MNRLCNGITYPRFITITIALNCFINYWHVFINTFHKCISKGPKGKVDI